jgi:hypothetical protein
MGNLLDHPLLIFVFSMLVLGTGARLGARFLAGRVKDSEQAVADFDIVLAASLTLLGLIIGFSFSMALSRYDQRKDYEEAEANAIGTEYVRAGLLADPDTAKVRTLLKDYVGQRILFYTTRNSEQLQQIDARTTTLRAQLWAMVESAAKAQQTPIMSLVAAGMNDVLNSQGYTQAAWWNRIPPAAWGLMGMIALICNVLVGLRAGRLEKRGALLVILPLIISIAFLLIADIDSPRSGIIHVKPLNLLALSATLS